MAYIFPSDITQLAFDNAHTGELRTLERLKKELPNEFRVFHTVHWSLLQNRRPNIGEIDFIVVNQNGDCLFIEQKDGHLDETAEGLVKYYASGPKNVPAQIRRNMDGARDKYRKLNDGEDLWSDYLFFCPDYHIKAIHAAGLEADHIVDAGNAQTLCAKIEQLLHANQTDEEKCVRVYRFFGQFLDLVPDIHAHISQNEKTFTRLNGGLAEVVQNIEMSPFRLRVQGSAGSGKTLVAIQAYERALERGKRPLLVCFNRPLREQMNAKTSEGGLVQTWYGLCDKFLESQGHKLDFDQMNQDPDFWDKAQQQVLAQEIPEEWKFDSLIVDEGQDFEPGWHEFLELFLQPNYNALWLEDPEQNIRRTTPTDLDEYVVYHDKRNYRTPFSIARFIDATLPIDIDGRNELPGLGVGVRHCDDVDSQGGVVGAAIDNLIRIGFKPGQITVLTLLSSKDSLFNTRERVRNFTLKRFAQHYDLLGNQVMTKGQIQFDSIGRFKGQQAPAVILVDVDPDPNDLDHWYKLLYAGMTRATVRLEIVANGNNPIMTPFFDRAH